MTLVDAARAVHVELEEVVGLAARRVAKRALAHHQVRLGLAEGQLLAPQEARELLRVQLDQRLAVARHERVRVRREAPQPAGLAQYAARALRKRSALGGSSERPHHAGSSARLVMMIPFPSRAFYCKFIG